MRGRQARRLSRQLNIHNHRMNLESPNLLVRIYSRFLRIGISLQVLYLYDAETRDEYVLYKYHRTRTVPGMLARLRKKISRHSSHARVAPVDFVCIPSVACSHTTAVRYGRKQLLLLVSFFRLHTSISRRRRRLLAAFARQHFTVQVQVQTRGSQVLRQFLHLIVWRDVP